MKFIPSIHGCQRCGTCCRNGGPALHLADRLLVEQGLIHTRHLYTIRRGERAQDPIRGGLVRVGVDIIKVKGSGGSWACCFLDNDSNQCRIYENRPLECRELACWDTSRLERMYARDRLSRRDLLAGVDGLWELIVHHERRCDYDLVFSRRRDMTGSEAETVRLHVAEIIAFDAEIRRLMISRGRLEPGMLDFLLGRPVEQVLRIGHSADARPSNDKVKPENGGAEFADQLFSKGIEGEGA